jgi:dTDP-4-amino-4,6-dideoxygalactose transaminase
MAVPFADLQLQYQSIKSEIDGAIASVIRDSAFIRGPYVDAFEREFAEAVGVKHCVSCANGTDALYLAMAALGVRPGDEVITTAHSWISTSAMITHAGATPVFCDTDGVTYTIDPGAIEAAITPRTVGIIPVHLYGQPADMDAIMAIARKHNLWVIEDCAQAHLASYKGQSVGTFGVAATYSFYPGKNLGAMGDAGAVVTNDATVADRVTMLARHGGLTKHEHKIEGINSRLDGLQAAILSAKLPHLRAWTKARQDAAKIYNMALDQRNELSVPHTAVNRTHVHHLYTIQHSRRDQLVVFLQARGIQTSINYPTALPFLPAYGRFNHRPEQFPNAYRQQGTIISLPLFAGITASQQEEVIEAIIEFAGHHRQGTDTSGALREAGLERYGACAERN